MVNEQNLEGDYENYNDVFAWVYRLLRSGGFIPRAEYFRICGGRRTNRDAAKDLRSDHTFTGGLNKL